jgi:hypothetical protein
MVIDETVNPFESVILDVLEFALWAATIDHARLQESIERLNQGFITACSTSAPLRQLGAFA